MSGVIYREAAGADDAEPLATVHALRREVDGVIGGLQFEAFPSAENVAQALTNSEPRDWVIAESGGKVVAYGHTLYDWAEHDGRHCYLHLGWVAPAARGQGIGAELLDRLETRCREKASRDNVLGRADIGANASGTEHSARELLENSGYSVIYTLVQMERPIRLSVEVSPIPAGYELRAAVPEHHRQIWQMIGDAYFDPSESGRGGQVASEEDFRSYFGQESADPSLWFVAWRGSRVAGVALCRLAKGIGEVYEVSVAHPHRRRGVARALLSRGVAELERRQPQAVRILTRKEFPTQAWRLYESVGFRVIKEFPRWRKEISR